MVVISTVHVVKEERGSHESNYFYYVLYCTVLKVQTQKI
jgi:hypothetical protein